MAIVSMWPHRVNFQLFFADAQPPANFIHPRLVFRDHVQFAAHVNVGPAIADISDQDFFTRVSTRQSWWYPCHARSGRLRRHR